MEHGVWKAGHYVSMIFRISSCVYLGTYAQRGADFVERGNRFQVGFAKQTVGGREHVVPERQIEGGRVQIHVRPEQIPTGKRTRFDIQTTSDQLLPEHFALQKKVERE